MNGIYRMAVSLVTGFLTVACGSAAGDWDKATAANTPVAYQTFLQNHSNDTRADDARAQIARLQDDNDWTTAKSENSEKSYVDYVRRHATGTHVGAAHDELTSLQRAVAWNDAKQKLAALEIYRVQLEATHSKAAAERKLKFAKQHFGKELRDAEIASPIAPDTLYRVLSSSMSHDDASSACRALQRAHEACEVVGAG